MPEETQDLSKTIHRVLGIVIRRRWWLIAITCIVASAVSIGSFLLPNKFTSEATILVVQQQVPERYVIPNSTYSVRQALDSLTEAVLSRSQLLPMINSFGLYPNQRQGLGPEGLAQLMRKDIQIEPIQKDPSSPDINAFKVSFTAGDPHVAEGITSKLTALFIDENLRLQEQQDTGTTGFLKDHLAAAQNDLKQQEARLRNFRMQYLGELPEQQQGNLAILSGLHMQLQNTMGDISRAQEQRVYLTSLLDQYKSLSETTGVAVLGGVNPLERAQSELVRLKSKRASLLAQYTSAYPGIQQIGDEITQQEKLIHTMQTAKKPASKKGRSASLTSSGAAMSSSLVQLNSQLEENRVETVDLVKGEKALQAQIAQYEQRLNLTPVREQQLSDIMRNYDLSKKNYADLLSKVNESELATSLEQRQQGQQFRVIDPANLPEKPSSPKRVKIALGGLAAGLFLSAALAFLIDSMDHVFYSEKDLSEQFKVPIVVGLPAVLIPSEERRRSWKRAFEWCAATALVLALLVAEYYVYRGG
jgi:succinoglycan biosynthesis transport protein ExoP